MMKNKTIPTGNNMDESLTDCAEQKKPDTNSMYYDSIYSM